MGKELNAEERRKNRFAKGSPKTNDAILFENVHEKKAKRARENAPIKHKR